MVKYVKTHLLNNSLLMVILRCIHVSGLTHVN